MTGEEFIQEGAALFIIGQLHEPWHERARHVARGATLVEHEGPFRHFRDGRRRHAERHENRDDPGQCQHDAHRIR